MSDIILVLKKIKTKCDPGNSGINLNLLITNSPITALSGENLENIPIVGLEINENMENLNDINMEIFSASYKTLRNISILNGSCRKCGKSIMEGLKKFSNLDAVSLNGMEIHLDNDAFNLPICDGCAEFFSLTLTKCSLSDSSIAENAFAKIERKVHLSMMENYLTKLDEKTFRPLLEKNSGNKISLKGNKLICNCNMQWTLKPETKFVDQLPDASCDDGRLLSKHTYEELCRKTEGINTTFEIPTNNSKSEPGLSTGQIVAISAASVVTAGGVGLICCKFTCPKYFAMCFPCTCSKWAFVKLKKNTTNITGVGGTGNVVTLETLDVTGENITKGIPSSS
jgi:hypothetical protein